MSEEATPDTGTIEVEKQEPIELDPETGLPKLPDGYVYQISNIVDDTWQPDRLSVRIVRVATKKNWFKRLVGEWLGVFDEYCNEHIDYKVLNHYHITEYAVSTGKTLEEAAQHGVRKVAEQLHKRFYENNAESLRLRELKGIASGMVGMYPPRKFG